MQSAPVTTEKKVDSAATIAPAAPVVTPAPGPPATTAPTNAEPVAADSKAKDIPK